MTINEFLIKNTTAQSIKVTDIENKEIIIKPKATINLYDYITDEDVKKSSQITGLFSIGAIEYVKNKKTKKEELTINNPEKIIESTIAPNEEYIKQSENKLEKLTKNVYKLAMIMQEMNTKLDKILEK